MYKVDKVKQLREALRLTQQQVADRLGIHYTTYSLKESLGRKFEPDEMYELSKIFNKSIEKIFFE